MKLLFGSVYAVHKISTCFKSSNEYIVYSPIWSKYPYGPARTRPCSYGPDSTRTVQIRVWSGTYIYLYVCILLINIKFMLQASKTSINVIFMTMYLYCVYSALLLFLSCNVKMSKCQKQAPNCFLNKSRNKRCSIFVQGSPLSHVPYTVTADVFTQIEGYQ